MKIADCATLAPGSDRCRFFVDPPVRLDCALVVRQITMGFAQPGVLHFETQTMWIPLGQPSKNVPYTPVMGAREGNVIRFAADEFVIPARATWALMFVVDSVVSAPTSIDVEIEGDGIPVVAVE